MVFTDLTLTAKFARMKLWPRVRLRVENVVLAQSAKILYCENLVLYVINIRVRLFVHSW